MSLVAIANKLVTEGVEKAERIEEQLASYSNQKLKKEADNIEKVITAMMLLGCRDLHGSNIGIMDIKHEEIGKSETTKKVHAKVDMSASFENLKYINYLDYIGDFEYMLDPQQCSAKYSVDYSKLKEEINKALFIENPDYVESLIYRALFYTKPLLKEEELGLVNELAKEVIKQVELLKEFSNSENLRI